MIPLPQRISSALALHVPARHTKSNHARPNCTECGFPHPCKTVEILIGAQQ